MKHIEKFIASFLVLITFVLTYLLPVRKRVAIISYFNKEYGLEFTKIVNGLEYHHIQVVSNLHKFDSSLKGKFKYLFSFIYQTYLFNTCKVIVLDGNNFVHSTITKKDKVQVIQVWHSTGAIKVFGDILENRRYKIKGYDYIVSPSSYFNDIYAKSFDTDISKVKNLGVSKTDYLFDKDYLKSCKAKFYKKYPDLKNKRLILYAPTFRGSGIEDMNIELESIRQLEGSLDKDSQLIVRLHPLVKKDHDFFTTPGMDLYTLLSVCDVIISDYSALVFDSVILNKRVILYIYDLDHYIQSRGLCVDIDDFDLEKAYNIKDLIDLLKKDFNSKDQLVKEKYLSDIDGHSSERIVSLILDLL